ncbi:MAG: response regulator transcription factor [Proteobacteria bacterium]|nr:response regulator transcription factor [Pseudomonadota bacterium]
MIADSERPYVYLVDGDETVRASYRRLLQPLGYHIEDFADSAGFLRSANLEAAGCVVLDYHLPELSGPELHERLRLAASPLAVVFVSAQGDVPAAVRAMQRGACDFLLKPVREQQLLDVVNRALRKSAADAVQGRARRAVLNQLARLTPREQEVLLQLVEGVHYDRVSSALGITKRTVEAHRRRIMEKMGARTLPQLLQQLARAGWPGRTPLPRESSHTAS